MYSIWRLRLLKRPKEWVSYLGQTVLKDNHSVKLRIVAVWAVVGRDVNIDFEWLADVSGEIELKRITGNEHAQFFKYPKQSSVAIDSCL